MSDTTTQGIRIQVKSEYLEGESDPEKNAYFFAYHITISNEGDQEVQLLNRHWIITDSDGKTEEVKGEGVIGEQPVLKPGEEFNYTSFCPLKSPVGTMHGSFEMTMTSNGEHFAAKIAPFTLAVPGMLH